MGAQTGSSSANRQNAALKPGFRKEKLTFGERHWLRRKRLKEDQHAAARRIGVTRWVYQKYIEKSTKNPRPFVLADHEWCSLLRRRANKSQKEIAEKLGISRFYVNRMEVGLENCERLLTYWGQ